jgi:hypothetical protein
MVKYFILFYSLVIFSIPTFSQEKWSVEKLFGAVEQHYKKVKHYSYNSEYKFYESEKSTKCIEKRLGIILRNDNVSYQKMGSLETLNFGTYTALIDSDKKNVQVSKLKSDISPIALESFLKTFPNKKIIPNPNYWICELGTGELQISQYYKICFFISKKDFSLHKQVFYMAGNQKIKKDKKVIQIKNPRLEITLVNKVKDEKIDTQLVTMSNYFTIKNKKINLSKRFKTYKLITL